MKCDELWEILKRNELTFFTGIPDSTFKGWMSFLNDMNGRGLRNIIACNECEAIAIASGYHLATGKVGVAYMQNAGEGKTVNPLTSLADPEVYSIPMLLIIGWRGEPGTQDEPQHKKMGRVTLSLLDTLEVPFKILPNNKVDAGAVIAELKALAEEKQCPVAIIIKKGLVDEYEAKNKENAEFEMKREEAIKAIVGCLDGSEAIISTTGKTSRELFEYRLTRKEQSIDFYTVGSMGCSASIALGIALEKPARQVFIFDGDGAAIMQMGALSTIGHYKPNNMHHIIFDNQSHDSTGGQPTVSDTTNFEKVAMACGYKSATTVIKQEKLKSSVLSVKKNGGPSMIVVKVNKGARKDLGRPKNTPIENKNKFMKFLKISRGVK
ncbi:phosphonopyruvate decarboxylase [Candidatus Woesearchaeota archaeon]|nr:phosphonopyruvate decarboxylase [Candidatus Woesearchaeota archaeon]